MNAMLAEYGIEPDHEQAKQILDKIKNIGDQGKHVTDVELVAIASEVPVLRSSFPLCHGRAGRAGWHASAAQPRSMLRVLDDRTEAAEPR